MYKKALGMFLFGTLFFFCSCVDDTYDLANKEISTDVEIKNNKVSLPLGSLRAILLDSLISVEDMDLLDQTDGIYSISMADTIAPYKFEMPEIQFTIPSQNATVEVNDFAKADITKVNIQGQSPEETRFDVPSVSLDDMQIPNLTTDRAVSTANEQVRTLLDQFSAGDLSNTEGSIPVQFDEEQFSLEDGMVEFNMSYTLPKEIKSISTIWLQSANNRSDKGALIGFEIIHPVALRELEKTVDFTIIFPEDFVLALAPNAADNYELDGNTIRINNMYVKGGDTKNTVVQFYIEKLVNLEDKIEDGVLTLNKTINYFVNYTVNGTLNLTAEHKLDDFNFMVESDLGLTFSDVEGETNDLEVAFSPITMSFDIDFDNLQYIDRIEYIDFDASHSKLHFHTNMEGGFAPFALKEGYALKLAFPEELIINEALSEYPRTNLNGNRAIDYSVDEHAFYIYDLEVFNNLIHDTNAEGNPIYYHWALALDSFILHAPVIDGEFHHSVEALATVVKGKEQVENLVLQGTHLESMNTTLKSLESKNVNFEIWESDLTIDDAVVHTEKIISDLQHSVTFEFENNDLPKEIRRVESIGFEDNAPIFFKIKINGLENLEKDVTLDLHVKLPSALNITADVNNKDVKIIGDTLYMKTDIDPKSNEPAVIPLMCEGLDFTKGLEGNKEGLRPQVKDEKGYIKYESDINIVGKVYIDGSEFHSEVLESDISVDVDFEIDDIHVKDFHGIFYIDDIGGIEQSFDLNLGDNMDFLSNENNSIVLSDPQISISVNNAISIPIKANLSLIGKDANGQVIESSHIEDVIEIDAADYDHATGMVTPRTTNLLLSAHAIEKEGYKNMVIANLANLLKQIPSSIDIMLTPMIDTLETQHINLIQPLSFSGNYAVDIPLQFDEFKFVYSDTIADLTASLGDMMEMFSNVKVGLNMNIKNSLPFELSFKAVPLNVDGDTIHGIEVSEFMIPAGTGTAYSDTIPGNQIDFEIKSKDVNDITAMDKLKFDIEASVNSTVGGAALRGDQGIKLSDIVIKISGDISTNLNLGE